MTAHRFRSTLTAEAALFESATEGRINEFLYGSGQPDLGGTLLGPVYDGLHELCPITMAIIREFAGLGEPSPENRKQPEAATTSAVIMHLAMKRRGNRRKNSAFADFMTDLWMSHGVSHEAQRALLKLGLAEHADTWLGSAAARRVEGGILGRRCHFLVGDNAQRLLPQKRGTRARSGSASRMVRMCVWRSLPFWSTPESTGLSTKPGVVDEAFLAADQGDVHPAQSCIPPEFKETRVMVDVTNPFSPFDANYTATDRSVRRPATEAELRGLSVGAERALAFQGLLAHFQHSADARAPLMPRSAMCRARELRAAIKTHVRGGSPACFQNLAKKLTPFWDQHSGHKVYHGTMGDATPGTRVGLLTTLGRVAHAVEAQAAAPIEPSAGELLQSISAHCDRYAKARGDPEVHGMIADFSLGCIARLSEQLAEADEAAKTEAAKTEWARSAGSMPEDFGDAVANELVSIALDKMHTAACRLAQRDETSSVAATKELAAIQAELEQLRGGSCSGDLDEQQPPAQGPAQPRVPQESIIVGGQKFLCGILAAIESALLASSSSTNLASQARLRKFVLAMGRFAFMHGELHLLFHSLQSIARVWWGLFIMPSVSLLQKKGMSDPEKGPIEKYELFSDHVRQVADAAEVVRCIHLFESADYPGHSTLAPKGKLSLPQFARWFDSYSPPSDIDNIVLCQFTAEARWFHFANRAISEHLEPFVDVCTKGITPMFMALGKNLHTALAMRATEVREQTMPPFCKLAWETQRFHKKNRGGRAGKGAACDTHVEKLNQENNVMAGGGANLGRNTEIASSVATSRALFRKSVGIADHDPGNRITARHDGTHDLAVWLLAGGVSGVGSDSAGVSCSKLLQHQTSPSTREAVWLSCPGSQFSCKLPSGAPARGEVVRTVYDHCEGALQFVLDVFGYDTTRVHCRDVGMPAPSAAGASTINSTTEREAKANEAEARDRDALRALSSMAGTADAADDVGAPTSCTKGNVPWGSTDLAPWCSIVGPAPTGAIKSKPRIAHRFRGAPGWHVGKIEKRDRAGQYITVHPGDPTKHPHHLGRDHYRKDWALIDTEVPLLQQTTAPQSDDSTQRAPEAKGQVTAVVITEVHPNFTVSLANKIRHAQSAFSGPEGDDDDADAGGGTTCANTPARKSALLGNDICQAVGQRKAEEEEFRRRVPSKLSDVHPEANDPREAGEAAMIHHNLHLKRLNIAVATRALRERCEACWAAAGCEERGGGSSAPEGGLGIELGAGDIAAVRAEIASSVLARAEAAALELPRLEKESRPDAEARAAKERLFKLHDKLLQIEEGGCFEEWLGPDDDIAADGPSSARH